MWLVKQNTKDHTITEKHIYINTSIVFFCLVFFFDKFLSVLFFTKCVILFTAGAGAHEQELRQLFTFEKF